MLSCHSVQRMLSKMNTRHQAHKPVNKCNYWARFSKRNGQDGQKPSNCVSMPNFAATVPTVAEIIMTMFSIFPRWRPSAILDLLCLCSDHPRGAFCVFIAVQNLVGIDAVVLIICMFSISRVWLENAYSRLQNWGFGGFYP